MQLDTNNATSASNDSPKSLSQLFDQALAEQQQKNWDTSLETYQKLLDQSRTGEEELSTSQASVVYHNMSVIANEKGDHLKAYVWSKKSTLLDSNNSMAKDSFSHYSKNFDAPKIPRQISTVEQYNLTITKLPLDAWFILSICLVFLSFWLTGKYYLNMKKNLLAGVFTKLNKWPIYLSFLISLFFIFNSYLSFLDSKKDLAIVIADKAQIKTAADEKTPVIYEATAGVELEVLRFENGYFLVRYLGAFSGWVQQNQIELLGLKFEQEKQENK